ncbi:hypothetical protein H310_05420 [Aphanomyces invadans]|uniref:Uncharacterized protein n=1 Tax=Aphanomyces invadans TaxID=157072 RepID=A0A024U9V8_9STRA|nr:hypothetical protein H310_05420 [Aphanomyces invadans]ETW02980.1 hypothetical protein H310_05420 [Aphanomyces invadans]|eukprot:XP_008868364.1 hypothetical protein H310_05420 [Aphanomyces invadans]
MAKRRCPVLLQGSKRSWSVSTSTSSTTRTRPASITSTCRRRLFMRVVTTLYGLSVAAKPRTGPLRCSWRTRPVPSTLCSLC